MDEKVHGHSTIKSFLSLSAHSLPFPFLTILFFCLSVFYKVLIFAKWISLVLFNIFFVPCISCKLEVRTRNLICFRFHEEWRKRILQGWCCLFLVERMEHPVASLSVVISTVIDDHCLDILFQKEFSKWCYQHSVSWSKNYRQIWGFVL